MRTSSITMRILLAIGAGSLGACGSTGTDAGADAGADARITDGGSGGDAFEASANDAPDDVVNDVPAASDGPIDAVADSPACVRRPFLVGGVTRAGAARSRADWGTGELEATMPVGEDARRALAAAWLEDGLQEHASIAAFARFTLMALSVGARPEHVAGAQRASLDEVAHARACFALARRYGGEDVGPGEVSLDGALGPLSLAELAVLTVHEGCVGETLGVQIAAEQLRGATDPLVCRTLRKIVRDEMRHAELAWSFVRWALEVGDASLRGEVARAFQDAARTSRAMVAVADPEPGIADAWRAHGRLTGAETRASVEAGLRDVVGPCAPELLAGGAHRGGQGRVLPRIGATDRMA
jgi:hypothetical protein